MIERKGWIKVMERVDVGGRIGEWEKLGDGEKQRDDLRSR